MAQLGYPDDSESSVLANEDALDRRLHVVVDASRAGAAIKRECPVVRLKHHLLARIQPPIFADVQPLLGRADRR